MSAAEDRASSRSLSRGKTVRSPKPLAASHLLPEPGEPAPVIHRAASLAEEVYEAIFARLMALRIPPGARITVDNLVRELAVSQTPIREALGRLEGEGLVVKTHLVGYSAAPQITRDRFEELYELRLLLEPEMAGRVQPVHQLSEVVRRGEALVRTDQRAFAEAPGDSRQSLALAFAEENFGRQPDRGKGCHGIYPIGNAD